METLLFVYGTLKHGHCRSGLLEGQKYLGPAATMPDYRLYDCGEYPGLVEVSGGTSVEGELWSVTPECLAILDREECLAVGLFRRGPVHLLAGGAAPTIADCYFYNGNVDGLRDCGPRWG